VLRYIKLTRQKIELSERLVLITLYPLVGHEVEVDWGRCTTILGGLQTILKFFCTRSKLSRKHFVRDYLCKRQQALFGPHIQTFSHFKEFSLF